MNAKQKGGRKARGMSRWAKKGSAVINLGLERFHHNANDVRGTIPVALIYQVLTDHHLPRAKQSSRYLRSESLSSWSFHSSKNGNRYLTKYMSKSRLHRLERI